MSYSEAFFFVAKAYICICMYIKKVDILLLPVDFPVLSDGTNQQVVTHRAHNVLAPLASDPAKRRT